MGRICSSQRRELGSGHFGKSSLKIFCSSVTCIWKMDLCIFLLGQRGTLMRNTEHSSQNTDTVCRVFWSGWWFVIPTSLPPYWNALALGENKEQPLLRQMPYKPLFSLLSQSVSFSALLWLHQDLTWWRLLDWWKKNMPPLKEWPWNHMCSAGPVLTLSSEIFS